MDTSDRISYEQLVAVYDAMGFHPSPEDPFTFQREDGVVLFHSPTPLGEFYWTHVARDVDRTEELLGLSEGLRFVFLFNVAEVVFRD